MSHPCLVLIVLFHGSCLVSCLLILLELLPGLLLQAIRPLCLLDVLILVLLFAEFLMSTTSFDGHMPTELGVNLLLR
jgi:hypothetical protein